MRFIHDGGSVERDVELRLGRPDATVADLAVALGAPDGRLSIDGRETAGGTLLSESGLVNGSRVVTLPAGVDATVRLPAGGPTAALVGAPVHAPVLLRVIGGLDAGVEIALPVGRTVVGRGRGDGLSLASPHVSHAHCVFEVAADGSVGVADLGSANGTDLGGRRLRGRGSAQVGAGDVIGLGGGVLLQVLTSDRLGRVRHVNPVREVRPGGTLPFARAPRPADPPAPPPVVLPAPPADMHKTPFSIGQMLGPILMAAGIVALTKQWAYATFAALSPVMFLTNFIEERTRGRISLKRSKREYRAAMAKAASDLAARHAQETAARRAAVTDPAEALRRAMSPGQNLWERRPDAADFLHVSVGSAACLWIPPIVAGGEPTPEVAALLAELRVLPEVPVVIDIGADAVVGLDGDRAAALSVARSLICQAMVGSGPADVTLAVFTDPDRAADWDWSKWLPHGADPRSGSARLFASGMQEAEALARALSDAKPRREPDLSAPATAKPSPAQPVLLVVVDGATLLEGRPNPLRDLLAGLSVRCGGIVLTERLPALCTSVLDVRPDGTAMLSRVTTGEEVAGVLAAGVGEAQARELARHLARFDDPEVRVEGAGLPDQVTLLPLLNLPEVSGAALAATWAEGAADLRVKAVLGVTERELFTIDLDDDGPHALIAGTTGSGKSELLRTLIVSMAVHAGPEHLTFVLVDYKGGGALDECARLPHSVGLVTDLDEHLGERALRCLEAELRYREHLLRAAGLSHVRDYQRLRGTGRPELEPMPRLVVVIDEFATLVKALPDFVDALVGIAQRGRSLGMHLIMATQRPAGSVNDAIKNNVKLRIALRLESTGDSQDVIDDNAAAAIGSRQWGRAYYRLSAKEVLPVQTALSTGVTRADEERAAVGVTPFFLGMPHISEAADANGETDLQRLVAAALDAQAQTGIAEPRRPWPEQLPERLPLSTLSPTAQRGMQTDTRGLPTLALADDPDRQTQGLVAWDPAAGNLLVYGAVGAGTTSTLLSLTLALAANQSPDRLHIYALDMGHGDLAPLAALPHTGAHVGAGERERVVRLIRLLRRELDARKASGGREEPDWLVLLDNVGALASEFDKDVAGMNLMDDLARVYADGPAVGIRFAVTADRHGAVPVAWAALTQQKLLMRLADPSEFTYFDVKRNQVPSFVPGRAVVAATRQVVQIGWIGADPAEAVAQVCARWPHGVRTAREIEVLPTRVSASSLGGGARTGAEPWWLPLGVSDSTLAPTGVELYEHEHLLIAGTQRCGRSTTLCQIAEAVLNTPDPPVLIGFAPRRSPLRDFAGLTRLVVRYEDLEEVLSEFKSDRVLLLVDDAETVEEQPGTLHQWLTNAGPGQHLVAAGRAEAVRRAYGHWTGKVRESRSGVLLSPDHDLDGDLFGVVLPRTDRMASLPGRGYLVASGTVDGIQLAVPAPSTG